MNYAIMKSSNTGLLKTVNLNIYYEYDWDILWLVRSKNDENIVKFETEDEAEIFMLSNFNERMIEPIYMEIKDNTGQYYLG